MDILKFALGVRFDFLADAYTKDDVSFIMNEIASVLSAKDVEGLHIYGGTAKLNERDSGGVFTLVFMNGKMMRIRAVYHKLNGDSVIRSYLDHTTPFIQNNVIRDFNGLEFFGEAGPDGKLTGGRGCGVVFPAAVGERKAFSEDKSIIIAPNSFKGTISSLTASDHLMKAIRDVMPDVNIIPVPMADGGDGTLSVIEKSMYCFRHGTNVTGPYGEKVRADYLAVDGRTAIIESALASGLALCGRIDLDPLTASSCGIGELILRAVHEGLTNIIICLGGSATNDCGIGLMRALGCKFLKADGSEAVSAGELCEIVSFDTTGIDPLVMKAKFTGVCDVRNPLTGNDGATYTFGPQKGADEETLSLLETGMLNMEKLLNDHAGKDVCSMPGAGAAGGIGAMLKAVLGASFEEGAEAVAKLSELDKKLDKAAVIITGEGCVDGSTMNGKAVGTVIEHAKRKRVPIAVIAGSAGKDSEDVLDSAVLSEFTGSEADALMHFDEAAERLAVRIKKEFYE